MRPAGRFTTPFILRFPAAAVGTSITVLQLVTGAHKGVRIDEIGVSFKNTIDNEAAPVLVQLLYQTDAGTMSSVAPVVENAGNANTIQSSGQHTATVEPTVGNVIRDWYVYPQRGLVWTGPLIVEPNGTARRIGLKFPSLGSTYTLGAYIRATE